MRTTVLQNDGVLADGTFWAEAIPAHARSSQHFIITDRTVNDLYGDAVTAPAEAIGIALERIVMQPGEGAKSMAGYIAVCSQILARGIDSNSVIVGLGGGAVANLAGFVASTLYRGIGLIQLPTTLLAQLDATIDFKQAINGANAKNQIGSYYPASLVIVDPAVLQTLDQPQLASGMAESLKHALTEAPELFGCIDAAVESPRDGAALSTLIERTVALKAAGINDEAHNAYYEMLWQYGHAVAHALEHVTQHRLLHGEAVAIGMCVTAAAGERAGIGTAHIVDIHHSAARHVGLPDTVPTTVDARTLWDVIRADKHFHGDTAPVAFVDEIGHLWRGPHGWGFPLSRSLLLAAVESNRRRADGRL